VKLHLSYYSEKAHISVHDEVIEIKQFQIIVWVSVSTPLFKEWAPNTPRIPAILDIGNNHNFAITKEQLGRWAGISSISLPMLKKARVAGRPGNLHRASLWLHSDNDPFSLKNEEGIAVLDGDWPHLPILGLRALTNTKLQTFIYGDTKRVLIRTPPKWYWPF